MDAILSTDHDKLYEFDRESTRKLKRTTRQNERVKKGAKNKNKQKQRITRKR